MWDLATCADNEPNVVPVAFKDVTEGEVVATFKAMVEKMFNGAATAKGALYPSGTITACGMFNGAATAKGTPVFIRAWRSLFWKITTHKFHSYYKKEGFSYMMKEKEVSALYQKKMEEDIRCPLEYGLSVFGGKWKSRIICVLAAKNGVTMPFLETVSSFV